MTFLVVTGLLAFAAIGAVLIYNRLVQKRQMVGNGWSDIDVQLKRRADLIPPLVTSVKAYAAHERSLFEDVTAKRQAALTAGDDLNARAAAETALGKPVSRLVAVAEDYPDLKASDNFLKLQQELAETEEKIEMARRFYNGAVRELNITIESFPNILLASPLGFRQAAFFEIDLADRAVPSVGEA